MNYLLKGMESEERVDLLLALTSIRSEATIKALKMYLVQGCSESEICAARGITQSNFNRDLSKLNAVAGTVEQIKEIDWARFKSEK